MNFINQEAGGKLGSGDWISSYGSLLSEMFEMSVLLPTVELSLTLLDVFRITASCMTNSLILAHPKSCKSPYNSHGPLERRLKTSGSPAEESSASHEG